MLLFQESSEKDYVNPNAATDQQVFNSAHGLTGLAIELKRYTQRDVQVHFYNRVTINRYLQVN